MTEKKTTEAQNRATKKWGEKNKDKQRIYRYRSYARKYVRDIATLEDLEELAGSIAKRMEELKNGK